MSKTATNEFLPINIKAIIVASLASIAMIFSVFLSMMASYPLIMTAMMYGKKALKLSLAIAALICVIAVGTGVTDAQLGVVSLLIFILAYLVSTLLIESKNINQSFLKRLFGLNFVFILLFLSAQLGVDGGIQGLILTQIKNNQELIEQVQNEVKRGEEFSKDAIAMLNLLNDPEKLSKNLAITLPLGLLMGVTFMFWLNTYMAINSRFSFQFPKRRLQAYGFSHIRMPDWLIFAVIAALVIALSGDVAIPEGELIGISVLKLLGVFYFFQGFGVYLDFLSFARIQGFLRTFLIIFTVISANQVLAIIGLLDCFITFRKFLIKKNK